MTYCMRPDATKVNHLPAIFRLCSGKCRKLQNASVIKATPKARLARFKQPKQSLFRPELPRNTMGKVQKKALRDDHAGLFA